jgi:hypothetical protein
VLPDARVVDNGKFLLSAGISAGVDASLYIVARQHGQDVAHATAAYMEYDWRDRAVRTGGGDGVAYRASQYTHAAIRDWRARRLTASAPRGVAVS